MKRLVAVVVLAGLLGAGLWVNAGQSRVAAPSQPQPGIVCAETPPAPPAPPGFAVELN